MIITIPSPRFSRVSREQIAALAREIQPLVDERRAIVSQLVFIWNVAQLGITRALCGARDAQQAEERARAGDTVLNGSACMAIDAAIARHMSQVAGRPER